MNDFDHNDDTGNLSEDSNEFEEELEVLADIKLEGHAQEELGVSAQKEELSHQNEEERVNKENSMESAVNTPMIQLSDEDEAREVHFWSTVVICYVLGANPLRHVFNGFVNRIWKQFGLDKITMIDTGLFLVRFRTKEQQQLVLTNGHLLLITNR